MKTVLGLLAAALAPPAGALAQSFSDGRPVFVPLDRILVETDAPALCPAPEFRMRELAPDAAGAEQNHPSNLVRNNAELARTMGVTPEESAALTSANFARLFGA